MLLYIRDILSHLSDEIEDQEDALEAEVVSSAGAELRQCLAEIIAATGHITFFVGYLLVKMSSQEIGVKCNSAEMEPANDLE
jgi:acyl-CoA reductase-like NAD-dependent aldehyde dehydrogenase